MDLREMTEAALLDLKQRVDAELRLRRARCPSCGSDVKNWHLHICGSPGANLPMDSDAAKALTRLSPAAFRDWPA